MTLDILAVDASGPRRSGAWARQLARRWLPDAWGVRVARHASSPEGWPAGVGLRIAVVADTHANVLCMGRRGLASVVRRVNALAPDAVALVGDYCSQNRGRLPPEEVAGILAGLAAPLGVHAVQGNHDWDDDRAAIARGHGPTRTESAFLAAGLPMLAGRAVPLTGGVWIAGVESEGAPVAPGRVPPRHEVSCAERAAAVAAAIADVPQGAAVILLSHEPDAFAADLDPRVRLVLSGHTHGGQIRIGGWSPWIPSRFGMRFAHGRVREGGRELVVSAGLGSHFVAGVPVRLGMSPEICLVEVGGAA